MDNTVHRTVTSLKDAIVLRDGIHRHLQELFLLEHAGPQYDKVVLGMQHKLSDDAAILSPCTVLLIVKIEEQFSWDLMSPLVADKSIRVSGIDNSVATRIDGMNYDLQNCLVVGGRAMQEGSGKFVISFKIIKGYHMRLGVVSDGAACYKLPFTCNSTSGWGMNVYNGGLFGNGKNFDHAAGGISQGQVLTLELDTDAHTLKFWRDGHPHGPGYSVGVCGSLRWALSTGYIGEGVQIVATK
jgi:hypothetical protein